MNLYTLPFSSTGLSFQSVNCAVPVSSPRIPEMTVLFPPSLLGMSLKSLNTTFAVRLTLLSVPSRSPILLVTVSAGVNSLSFTWMSSFESSMELLLPMLICTLSFQVLV